MRRCQFDKRRNMEPQLAIVALSALAHVTRLDAFRMIVEHEPDGLAAGDIARSLGVPSNTMSTHLAILNRAGLISSERRSRNIIYRAEIDMVREIASFLDGTDLMPEPPVGVSFNPLNQTWALSDDTDVNYMVVAKYPSVI